MKLSKGEMLLYGIFAVVLIMVNPPVVNLVSDYAVSHPFICGWPTLLVWLNFWYLAAIIAFLTGAIRIKAWKKDYPEMKGGGGL